MKKISLFSVLILLVVVLMMGHASGVQIASYTPHDPIDIDGNGDFVVGQNGVVSGSGTLGDPYVIENWDIYATSGYGIYIQTTNDYFVIRNCLVHGNGSNSGGIYLHAVENGMISYVNVYNNYDGIELYRSSSIDIRNSDVYNNSFYGIELWDSPSNSISDCNAYGNYKGFEFFDSSTYSSVGNVLRNNAFYNNSYNFGFRCCGSVSDYYQDIDTSNTVDGKPIYYVIEQTGITYSNSMDVGYLALISCSNIEVENLVLSNNAQGLLLVNTSGSTVTNCVLRDNGDGIDMRSSSDSNQITGCNGLHPLNYAGS